jgi:Xaa-Pro aminopeptidase
MDRERIERMKRIMKEDGVDVLICRLPENVLYLSGYWPVIGASLAVFTSDGETTLILPFSELDYAAEGWVQDQRTYRFINLERMTHPTNETLGILQDLEKEKGFGRSRLGYEGGFELVAGNNVAAEARVVAPETIQRFMEAFPRAQWIDATATLRKARVVKSSMEIEQLRITNEIACMGYEVARSMIRAGTTEAEIAGAVEGAIYAKGVGYKNVKRARGYCFVMSGGNSVNSWRPFCVSTDKRLAWGEPVLVELDAMTNGYFNDLTRTFFVGPLDERARRVFDAVQEATQSVIDAVRPGVRAADLDGVARRVLEKAGFGSYFNHALGHGIGLQFHEPPALHPKSQDILEAGMVFAVEPAVYIPGFGGVRLEENLVVTEKGCERLTPLPQRVESDGDRKR